MFSRRSPPRMELRRSTDFERVDLQHEREPIVELAHPSSTEPLERRAVERLLHLGGDATELVEHEDHPEDDEHHGRRADEQGEVTLHPAQRAADASEREPGDEERQPEPERVRDEQRRARPDAVLRARDREDRAEDRPDAR